MAAGGRPGPPPKPTELSLLEGNPGKRPLPKDEPRPDPGSRTPPPWLSMPARREWRRIVPHLARLGLFTVADWIAVAIYCEAVATYAVANRELNLRRRGGSIEDAEEHLGRQLIDHRDNGSPMINPLVTIRRQALEDFRAFAGEFGFTPSARRRLGTVPDTKDNDGFDDFLDGAGDGAQGTGTS